MGTIDGETGEIPDELNPYSIALKHQRMYEALKMAPKSAEQVYEMNQ